MDAILIMKRVVILVVLLLTVLQLGGAAVRADLVAGRDTGSYEEKLSERFCREIGVPRSDMEACRMLVQIFG
jgi:hypothetical protein